MTSKVRTRPAVIHGNYAEVVDMLRPQQRNSESLGSSKPSLQEMEFNFDSAFIGYEGDEEVKGCNNRNCIAQQTGELEKRITLSEVLQTDCNESILLITGSPPFITVWVSPNWSLQYGWSAEELSGLDLNYMKGDSSPGIDLMAVYDVSYTEQSKSFDMMGYRKDGELFSCHAHCFPVFDFDARHNSWVLCNIGIRFTRYRMVLAADSSLIKVDRRKFCTAYISSPSSENASASDETRETMADTIEILMEHTIPELLTYAATTSTPIAIAITDRYGKVVTVNRYFEYMFGVSAFEASGRGFSFLCGALTTEDTVHNFPSSSTPHFISKKDQRAFELGKRLSIEFSAVLNDRRSGKPITCSVVSLPVAVSPTLHGTECLELGTGVYFVVCFRQLFVDDSPLRPLDTVLKTEYFQPFPSSIMPSTRANSPSAGATARRSRPASPDELGFFQFEA